MASIERQLRQEIAGRALGVALTIAALGYVIDQGAKSAEADGGDNFTPTPRRSPVPTVMSTPTPTRIRELAPFPTTTPTLPPGVVVNVENNNNIELRPYPPGTFLLTREELNERIRQGVETGLAARGGTVTPTPKPLPVERPSSTTVNVYGNTKDRDWPWWDDPIVLAAGIGIGVIAASRRSIMAFIHQHTAPRRRRPPQPPA